MYFASAQGARMQKTKAIPLPEKPNFSFPVKNNTANALFCMLPAYSRFPGHTKEPLADFTFLLTAGSCSFSRKISPPLSSKKTLYAGSIQ